jgi:Zn-dependent peptidase ImmA (M78 family)/transcriptional regulator with XRE-family HTH domain
MPVDPNLDRVRHRFQGERLLQARLARGMKKVDLARLIGVSPAAIGQYESSQTRPSQDVVGRLALAVGFPISFFESTRPNASLSEEKAHFRRLRSISSSARSLQIARLALLEELISRIEQDVELPQVDIPTVAVVGGTRSEIEVVAGEVRTQWNLGNGPIANVVALLESKGCVLARLVSGSDGVDAYSRWSGYRPIVVLTRDKDDAARSNFDAAHELGHLVLHQDPQPGSRLLEEEAQAFAAAFLMPAEGIGNELPHRFDVPTFIALKRRWRVSVQALLFRSRVLGSISEAAYKRAMVKISLWGWRAGEPDDIGEVEEPYLLSAAMELLIRERGLDSMALAEELSLPIDLMNEFVPPPVDRLRLEAPSWGGRS